MRDERDAQFRIDLPAHLLGDERVTAIIEDAVDRIEALYPDRDWDLLLSAGILPAPEPTASDVRRAEGSLRRTDAARARRKTA